VTGVNWSFNGNLSGSGDVTRTYISGSPATVYLGGDNSGFSGTFTMSNNASAVVRFASASAGSATAKWVFNQAQNNTRTTTDFTSGTIQFGSFTGNGFLTAQGSAGTRTYEVGNLGLNETFSGAIGQTGTGVVVAVTKVGTGTWTLSGSNGYTGATTINAGTLALGAANRISDSSAMVLNGGTFATGGFSETLNTLTLSSTSTIDFGLGTSALVFADSSAIAWSGTLNLTNFDIGTDSLKFGSSNSALTASQLSAISLTGYTASLDASGFVTFTAVPEPHEFALAIVGLLGVMIFIHRRNQQA
jgi:autotransporter-associated beta strand protein